MLDQEGTVLGKGHGPLHCWKQTVPLSELEGAKIALLCTTGPIHLLVDNAAVVKGIRRGPDYKRRVHSHRWKLFWEAAAGRPITVTKIKSHMERAEAIQTGMDPVHWLANSLADELAEAGARRAQLPAANVAEVLRLDKEAT